MITLPFGQSVSNEIHGEQEKVSEIARDSIGASSRVSLRDTTRSVRLCPLKNWRFSFFDSFSIKMIKKRK